MTGVMRGVLPELAMPISGEKTEPMRLLAYRVSRHDWELLFWENMNIFSIKLKLGHLVPCLR